MNLRIAGIALTLSFIAAAILPAGEAKAGNGPAACAPLAHRMDVPGLWLGHFSGGNWARYPSGQPYVDWRSEYQCFTSARSCYAWRASMKRVYRRFDGHGTCLNLRGGGTRVRYVREVISTRY